ncbi:MAG: hypothetical protein PHI13_10920, partial [Methylococcales bacterium]|nr:hypothetical protein [Methylococcales bacterium]
GYEQPVIENSTNLQSAHFLTGIKDNRDFTDKQPDLAVSAVMAVRRADADRRSANQTTMPIPTQKPSHQCRRNHAGIYQFPWRNP